MGETGKGRKAARGQFALCQRCCQVVQRHTMDADEGGFGEGADEVVGSIAGGGGDNDLRLAGVGAHEFRSRLEEGMVADGVENLARHFYT